MRVFGKQIKIKAFISRFIKRVYCVNCNRWGVSFNNFKGGTSNRPEFHKRLEYIGSDLDNYSCVHCGCNDRLRHLLMYFEHINFFKALNGKRVLHIAPEPFMVPRIKDAKPEQYIQGDFMVYGGDVIQIDATDIQFPNQEFDFIMCNHVLEHIPNYQKALSEFNRVLKIGGTAILQTPLSKKLSQNFCDPAIKSTEDRAFFYGQEDHVHVVSENEFHNSLVNAGFQLNFINHNELDPKYDPRVYGVNVNEYLVRVIKQ